MNTEVDFRILYAALYLAMGIIPREQLQQLENLFQKSSAENSLRKYPPLSKLVYTFNHEVEYIPRQSILDRWRWLTRDSSDKLLRRYYYQHGGDLTKIIKMIAQSIAFQIRIFDSREYLARGEQYYIRKEPEPPYIAQYKSKKLGFGGVDKQGRPIVDVWPKQHWPKMQSLEATKRMYGLIMEAAYMAQNDDTNGIIMMFDMSTWKLAHTDYSLLKFMTEFNCFAMPIIHKIILHDAPVYFQPAWAIIKSWFEPWYAKKFEFTQGIDDLLRYISIDQLPRHYGGRHRYDCGQWTTPREEDDTPMENEEEKQLLQDTQQKLREEYEKSVCLWILENDDSEKKTLEPVLENIYWQLDPYVRSRTVWDRHNVLGKLRPELAAGGIAQPLVKPSMPTYKPSVPIIQFCMQQPTLRARRSSLVGPRRPSESSQAPSFVVQ